MKLLVRGYRGFNGPEAGVVFPGWADSGVQGGQTSRGGGRVSRVSGFEGMKVRNEGGRRGEEEEGRRRKEEKEKEQVKNRTFTKG